ncbi:EF-P beta-lysylation protein EpmB [Idiomarina tyrosinivorans]|uniref:L-lysine 2,3-aminomutase n=1 Tax=Idiomarina tyrosinivorans TaxID=1445662 RepID=A0A432ZF69_9GAMM|nr:EF-P beta-lysylation protein EpmB [Idiomarina tyrosinivorans]RUO76617.1 EF-P beta-lysylation protein EpmB [Idiomarina tyrosinivorans]
MLLVNSTGVIVTQQATTTTVSVRALWQQQLAEAYRDPEALLHALKLDPSAFKQHSKARQLFPLMVPKPFVAQMRPGDPNDPLLRQVLPLSDEFHSPAGYSADPLGEQQSPIPGMLHKYRSRLLLIVKGGCAVNCRYCFRRHFPYAEQRLDNATLQQVCEYIAQHPDINEVILSGGDPLMANDRQLDNLLDRLEQLPQLRRLRIHSRLPVVIPARLTDTLRQRLNASRLQTILVLHANHANEISAELTTALKQWHQSGIHLLNQSVLLRGVNDSAEVLSQLSEALFAADVIPYYLHQLDKVDGASHFAVSDERARQLWQQMLAQLPGFLVPKLVREIHGEASKTPIMPNLEDSGV